MEIREAGSDQVVRRDWSPAELEQSIAWLKRMNAKGGDVYIRPAGEHGLVLVDGLKADAIEHMKRERFTPAAVVETSPGQYQAWVKLSAQAVPAAVRVQAARGLAQHFGGDVNSAGRGGGPFGAFGRLAGFTNQAPAHAQGDRHPYVLAHERSGVVAEAGPGYVERVDQALDKAAAKVESERRMQVLRTAKHTIGDGWHDPVVQYQREAKKVLARFSADADPMRMDWMIAVEMAKTGRFNALEIERGIAQCSPHVESVKAGHVEGYARRTAQKAWAAPEGIQQRQELQAKRDRGQELGGPSR